MKTATSDLFFLIKSMTGSEKRYFKLFSSVYERDKNYMRLFKILDKYKGKYNEVQLISTFKSELWIKRFPKIKHQLYNSIINCLESYQRNSGSSTEIKLSHQLLQAKILLEKGLHEQSFKLLKRIKRVGYLYEKNELLLSVINVELLASKGKINFRERYSILNEVKKLTDTIVRVNIYGSLESEVYSIFTKMGQLSIGSKFKGELDRIIKHPLLADERLAETFLEKVYYYTIHILYYGIKGSFSEALPFNDRLIVHMESKPHLLIEHKIKYVTILGNYLANCVLLNKGQEAEGAYKKISEICGNTKSVELAYEHLKSFSNYLSHCCHQGKFSNGYTLFKKSSIEFVFDKWNEAVSEVVKVGFYYNVFYMYYGLGEFSKSLNYLNKIIYATKTDVREDIQCVSRVVCALIYFETGEMRLLENHLKATQRFLSRHNSLHRLERVLLTFIHKRLMRVKNRNEIKSNLLDLRAMLKKIFLHPDERLALDYFDFISWVDSKIENRPFAEVLKAKAKSKLTSIGN